MSPPVPREKSALRDSQSATMDFLSHWVECGTPFVAWFQRVCGVTKKGEFKDLHRAYPIPRSAV
jgi:hypothetical protein